MSSASQIQDFKKKINTSLVQKLGALTEREMDMLKRRIEFHLRHARAKFFPLFADELTQWDVGDAEEEAEVSFGDEGAPENVIWHGLSEKYWDAKQSKGQTDFFVMKGRLARKLRTMTISSRVGIGAFNDDFSRVFGPIQVYVQRRPQETFFKGWAKSLNTTIRVVPFSRFADGLPRGNRLEKEIFTLGGKGFDRESFNALTNYGTNRRKRPALLPYTRWWIRTYAKKSVQKALVDRKLGKTQ